MISGVIFDLYGTMIQLETDSRPYHNIARSHNPKTYRSSIDLALNENFATINDWAAKIGYTDSQTLITAKQALESDLKRYSAFDDVIPTLIQLKNLKIKTAVISNLATPYKKPFYELRLEQYFDTIIFSCDRGLSKPNSQIYELALNELSLSPQNATMIGDSLRCDVAGPKSIGIKSFHLDRCPDSDSTDKLSSLSPLIDIVS